MVNILGPELLQIADSAAREKGIDRDEVIVAVEQAIQRAGRSKYGLEHDIRASIDRHTGEIRLARYREVVEEDAEIEDEFAQLKLSHAQRYNASAKVGDMLIDDLPPIDFGRVAAQSAKQVIVQKVREAERARQYREFVGRVGEIVNGL
ncbi:MAG: transcription termination/antitermination protein NusA, partial [Alphaproteobacteria bacterium]|nr:transcription termination/antitermination protein NusA [Alphaproteobacteria bacterium]